MLAIGTPILIGPDLGPGDLRLRQFDVPEGEFAWSMGRWAEVEFDLELDPPVSAPPRGGRGAVGAGRAPAARTAPQVLAFQVEVDVFRVPPVLGGQNVLTYLNGLRVHSAYVTGRTMIAFEIAADRLLAEGNRLTFDLPDAIRPLEFGMDDSRALGVKLFSIGVEAAEDR